MQSGAQEVGAIELNAAIFDDGEKPRNDVGLVDEIGQIFNIDVEFLDDLGIKVTIKGDEHFTELHSNFQQNAPYNLGVPSCFEIYKCRRLVLYVVHQED